MHVKSLIFDERVLLTGSVNMTHNGYENNKEHLYRITEPSLVVDVVADFEKDWSAAEPVTQQHIDTMIACWQKKGEKKNRSASRSLSAELDNASSDHR